MRRSPRSDTVNPESTPKLYRAPRSEITQDQGSFRIRFNFPGRNHPTRDDHGYGPLSTVVESFMDPDTLIPMHQHRDEEIISWVPDGVMRHDDREDNQLVTDPEHLMIMNAGRGFWHEERTLPEDPPLRMLQIFVRPHSLGLEPEIQHEPIPDPVENRWRQLFGPEGSGAPLFVRNDVECHDVRIGEDAAVELPSKPGHDTYFYVFEGTVSAEDQRFESTESGLLVGGGNGNVTVTAQTDALLVAFVIDPDAPITRQGTIGR